MADIIRLKTGEIVGFYPTKTQDEIDREVAEQEAQNRVAERFEREQAARADKIRKAAPSREDQMQAAIAGLRKLAGKEARQGRTKRADAMKKHADAAEAALDKGAKIQKKLGAKRPDPLGDQIKAAVAELRAVLPKAFPTDADAERFARRLPMLDATAEAGRLADAYAKTARARTLAEREFYAAIAAGGYAAFGSPDQDGNLRRLIEVGGD